MRPALSILGKTGKGSNNETTWKLEYIVLCGLMMWILVAFTLGAVLPAVYEGDTVSIFGYVCIATCMLYYFTPLTVLLEIIKNKDAAGLYTPMCVMNLITSLMWSIYGFAFVGDVVVYAPTMFAVLLSLNKGKSKVRRSQHRPQQPPAQRRATTEAWW